jgi:hypothetical protein
MVTWRVVGRLTHLSAKAQRRLWRMLLSGAVVLFLSAWAVTAALTRSAEKAYEQAGQTYVTVAPLAAEVMDLRDRRGVLASVPAVQAVEQVLRGAGVGPDRLRLVPSAALGGAEGVELTARSLSLRELAEVLRDLRLQAKLSTVSATIFPSPGSSRRMDLNMVLSR